MTWLFQRHEYRLTIIYDVATTGGHQPVKGNLPARRNDHALTACKTDPQLGTWRLSSYSPVALASLKSVSSLCDVSQFFMLTIRFPSSRVDIRIATHNACNRGGVGAAK